MHDVQIVGGGLTGLVSAMYLSRRQVACTVHESRPRPSTGSLNDGRSIHLTISHRGFAALRDIGCEETVRAMSVPVYGRVVHQPCGSQVAMPYSNLNQAIYCVSRARLLSAVLSAAECEPTIRIEYESKCCGMSSNLNWLTLARPNGIFEIPASAVIGTEGASSALRDHLSFYGIVHPTVTTSEYVYKELTIPPASDRDYAITPDAIHVWPRKHFMLMAFPSIDRSFNCFLFYSRDDRSLSADFQDESALCRFFSTHFSDIWPFMPNCAKEFGEHPLGTLSSVECYPWSCKGRILLMGDAAHAMLPFYGQGINAAFEDCQIFDNCLTLEDGSWERAVERFDRTRKADTDAITNLSRQNLDELIEEVANDDFIRKKKIEAALHRWFPDEYPGLYSMIAFTSIPYSQAIERHQKTLRLIEQLNEYEGIESELELARFRNLVLAVTQENGCATH